MTMTAGLIGLLASLPIVGGLFAFLPKLGLGRSSAPPPAETAAESADSPEQMRALELELLHARREILELREQLAWQTPPAQVESEGTAATPHARELVGVR